MADPATDDLREAVREGRRQARHIEKNRVRLLYLNVVAALGLVSGARVDLLAGDKVVQELVFFLAFALSFYSFFAFQKQSIELRNHRAASRWAAAELELLEDTEEPEETYLGVTLRNVPSESAVLFSAFPAFATATVAALFAHQSSLSLVVEGTSDWLSALAGGLFTLVLCLWIVKWTSDRWGKAMKRRRPSDLAASKATPESRTEAPDTEAATDG